MNLWMAIGTTLWLGVLTSISPCPLASNIAAISFIGRHAGRKRSVLLSGLLYTLGRSLAYAGLALLLLTGLFASGEIARFLQRRLTQLLGPVLIVAGMVLLQMFQASWSVHLAGEKVQARAERGGVWWACALGILFALSFCPVSAGIFFGALVPLAAANESRLLLPLVFGAGTAVPVLVFALLMALAAEQVGRAFNALTLIEKWARNITGTVFIAAGIYCCLKHVYGLALF